MKFCKECGTPLKDDAKFCFKCGQTQDLTYQTESLNGANVNATNSTNSDTSTIALVLGIISIIMGLSRVFSLIGLVLGIIAYVIDKTKSRKAITITGIVICSISLAIFLILTIFAIVASFVVQ